jgi:hypothetical protein
LDWLYSADDVLASSQTIAISSMSCASRRAAFAGGFSAASDAAAPVEAARPQRGEHDGPASAGSA